MKIFSNFSMTQGGNYIAAFCTLLALAGVNIDAEALTITLGTLYKLGTALGVFISFIGRWRQGDLNVLGGRKYSV